MNRHASLAVIAALGVALPACESGHEHPNYKPPEATGPNLEAHARRVISNLVHFPGDTFLMGESGVEHRDPRNGQMFTWMGSDLTAKPAHEVELSGFSISTYETTWREFDLYSRATGQRLVGKDWFDPEHLRVKNRHGDMPASVDWFRADAYCRWLGEITGEPFGLPTEAQWEYAARSGGRSVVFATDNGYVEPGRNYSDGSIRDVHPPGTYPPNPAGLYDMAGNLAEWTSDWYDPNYYQLSPRKDPKGASTGERKTARGGSMLDTPAYNDLYGRHAMVIKDVFWHREQAMDDVRSPKARIDTGVRCAVHKATPIQLRHRI